MAILISSVSAQKYDEKNFYLDTCESAEGKLAVIGNLLTQGSEKSSNLFLIAGSPLGAKSRYNQSRIEDVINYLSKQFGVDRERIVWGIGKNSAKNAYLRFYVGTNSVTEILTATRGRLCKSLGEPLVP